MFESVRRRDLVIPFIRPRDLTCILVASSFDGPNEVQMRNRVPRMSREKLFGQKTAFNGINGTAQDRIM